MTAVAALFEGLTGHAPAFLHSGDALSGHAVARRVASLAEQLQALGLSRIASQLDNGPDWLALDLAIRRLGGVHVPVPTFFSAGQAFGNQVFQVTFLCFNHGVLAFLIFNNIDFTDIFFPVTLIEFIIERNQSDCVGVTLQAMEFNFIQFQFFG